MDLTDASDEMKNFWSFYNLRWKTIKIFLWKSSLQYSIDTELCFIDKYYTMTHSFLIH